MDEKKIDEGLTNALWKTEKGTVVKYIAKTSWTVFIVNLFQLLFLNIAFLTRKRRLQNELRAKKVLERLDIPHPEIVSHDESFIEMEWVTGKPLTDYLVDSSLQACRNAGLAKGKELKRLHSHGSAYVDCRCSNTLVSENGTLFSVDHELFSEDASGLLKDLDLITLMATAKVLPEKRYKEFVIGLHEGYGNVFGRRAGFRVLFSIIAMMGYALIVKRSPSVALRCWRNWRQDIRQEVRQLPI